MTRFAWKRCLAGGLIGVLLASQLCAAAWPILPAQTVAGEASDTAAQVTDRYRFGADHLSGSGAVVYDAQTDAYRIDGSGILHAVFTLPASGDYQLAVTYRLEDGSSKPFVFTLAVNDREAARHELARVFEYETDGELPEDAQGNQIKPAQHTTAAFFDGIVRRTDYLAGEIYALPLQAGENTLVFTLEEQQAEVQAVTLFRMTGAAAYHRPAAYRDNSESLVVEAEYPQYTSDSTLYPVADRTSAATTPYHHTLIRLNTIGGSSWQEPGQWISWELPVAESGYYRISLRVRQNVTRGMRSFRRITIDGTVPCAELEAYPFVYSRDWQVVTLGNEAEDFYFYLTAGTHTLAMEATMGSTVAVYEELEQAVADLNALYLQIIKITGTSPDLYRTYNLDVTIPGLKEELTGLRDRLTGIVATYEAAVGHVGSELSFLSEMANMLDTFARDASRIPTSLDAFNSNISTMSTLLTTLTQQPLQVDKIQMSGAGATVMRVSATFLESLTNGVKSFFASFMTDYNTMGGGDDSGRSLTVWTTSARDQANILKELIDNRFTPQTGIGVRLSLVTSGLSEAVMAGRGPDVGLGLARTNPIDMGARGVLTDLTNMPDFDEVRARYQASALNAYTYGDKVFALPETQDFYLMYVRTDILQQLGLERPETWDDLRDTVSVLSDENMQIGMPQSILGSWLVQAGMTYYQPGFEQTVFSTQAAYDVYADYIRIYKDYEQPYYFNAGNRFKTGIMPIVIDLLSFANTIAVLAPEIQGQWDVYELPGMRMDDGTIRKGGDATGIASVLFKACEDTQAGYAFLSWWSQADVQASYGMELENRLGAAGRYTPANIEAFESLNWTASQRGRINAQRAVLSEIPEIPGSYIITRNMTNLFLDVMNNGAVLRESMIRYATIMDKELAYKQTEMAMIADD